eukprot:CAMPEP_0198250482 /NCGR_PEP_ID=MMETSP1447-20131203/1659_1 /TAXON_ID=420782 /ORGANISM="Chaetoceros dichaeta, Strain CCMP1751" /LENGTH=197 /DNA_ID=CAMNT_0043935327 /DNA_START=109 /DNA_END=702 /DNA_ORIENTATION=+
MTTYQNSEIQYATAEEQHLTESSSTNKKRNIYGIVTGCIAISVVILLAASNRVVSNQVMDDVSMDVSMGGAKTTVRACSFAECYSSSCNANVAPFTCLRHNGGPHGGCSPVEWSGPTCDDQCSMEHCGDMAIPEDTNSCAGVECGDDWCTIGQTCGPSVPYQCKDGSARFGCSADPLAWTLLSKDTECSVCCDATTC